MSFYEFEDSGDWGQFVIIDNIDPNVNLLFEKNTDTCSIEKKSTNRDIYTVLINNEAKNVTDNRRYDVIEIREENDKSQILEFNVKDIIVDMVSLIYQMFKFNLY